MAARPLCLLEKNGKLCCNVRGHFIAHAYVKTWSQALTDHQKKAVNRYAEARGGRVSPVVRRALQMYGLLDVFQDETFGETFVLSAKGWEVYKTIFAEVGQNALNQPPKERSSKELFWSFRHGLRDGTEGRLKQASYAGWTSYEDGYRRGRITASSELRAYAEQVGYDTGPASLLRSIDTGAAMLTADSVQLSKDSSSAILCDHANEVPHICPCSKACYCRREGSCQEQ